MYNVLMTATTLAAPGRELLERSGCRLDCLSEGTQSELARAVRSGSYDAVISRTLPVSSDIIDALPNLRVISRHGVGYNNVDVDSATHRGIPVLIADGANAQSVAELTVGLALAAARNICSADTGIRAGKWDRAMTGVQLWGKTAGIVAFGAIGRRVGGILRAFGMEIVAFDPHAVERGPEATWVETLDELLERCDLVCLHCPLTPETDKMISGRQFALMKKGAILVNTARGGLVDEGALAEAIVSGHLGGAGLDTFAVEPLGLDHPFLAVPQIVMTPHIGGSTDAALDGVAISAARNVIDVLLENRVDRRLIVNPSVLDQSNLRAKGVQQ